MTAVWAVMTVRDPMRGRVKALQERREQLKAGIVASRKRASLVQRNSTHDQMRNILKSMSVLQDEQVKAAQQKLAHAGIRPKDAAVAVIFAPMLLPNILGGGERGRRAGRE